MAPLLALLLISSLMLLMLGLLQQLGVLKGPSNMLIETKKKIARLTSAKVQLIDLAISGANLTEVVNKVAIDQLYRDRKAVLQDITEVLDTKFDT